MSSEEVDKKSEEETKEVSSSAEENETKDDTEEEKVNSKPASKKKGAEPAKIKQPAKKRMKTEQAEKESKKAEKKKAPKDKEESDEEEEQEEEEVENHKAVPLLDQPLEVSGSRKRKEVQRFTPKVKDDEEKKDTAIVVGNGKGVALGKIEVVEFAISRAKIDNLKLLHKLCFNKSGKQGTWQQTLMKFNGWDFEEGSDDFEKKKVYARGIKKVLVSQLKELCTLLDIEAKGSRDDLMDRILSFLVCPVDSGRKLAKGRSKRKGALSKNYDEGNDTYKDRKRGSPKKKDEKSLASEESDHEESAKEVKQNNKKKAANSTEESAPEEEEEKEEEEKPKKKAAKKGGKKAAEPVTDKKAPPKKRGAAKKAAPPAAEKTDSEGAAEGDDESEGEEPEPKKAKTPPTDEEIKTYVKSLLEGANLEEITMKKVCQDVYAHYPEFDLSSKKDFIKTTVKNVISS